MDNPVQVIIESDPSAIYLSIASILLSALALWLTYKSNKKNTNFDIYNMASSMYKSIHELENEVLKHRHNGPEEDVNKYWHAKEALMNQYEVICYFYKNDFIDKASFDALFKDNLINVYKNGINKRFFDGKEKKYNYVYIKEVFELLEK